MSRLRQDWLASCSFQWLNWTKGSKERLNVENGLPNWTKLFRRTSSWMKNWWQRKLSQWPIILPIQSSRSTSPRILSSSEKVPTLWISEEQFSSMNNQEGNLMLPHSEPWVLAFLQSSQQDQLILNCGQFLSWVTVPLASVAWNVRP